MDERFLFNGETGDVFTLNPSGALVYELYSAGLPPREIARRLKGRYGVSEPEALDDVHAFLAEVRVHGFLAS